MTATSKQIAQRSLVDVSVLCKVTAGPAAEDSCSIDRRSVDRPFLSRLHRQTKRSRLAWTSSRKFCPVASMYSPTRRRDTSIARSRSLTPVIAARELA